MKDLINSIRDRHGIPLTGIARALNVSDRSVRFWRDGKVTPPPATLDKLKAMADPSWAPPADAGDRRKVH